MMEFLREFDPIIQLLIFLVVGAFLVGLLKFVINNFFEIILILIGFLIFYFWPVIWA